jgi:hypothetical protein
MAGEAYFIAGSLEQRQELFKHGALNNSDDRNVKHKTALLTSEEGIINHVRSLSEGVQYDYKVVMQMTNL